MLEFALTFPVMLIIFLFCWQVIRVYIYDVLGSYAAFAAARSYAVYWDHDFSNASGTDGDVATWLARDVAASALAPYSTGLCGEETELYGGNQALTSHVVIAFQSNVSLADTLADLTGELTSGVDAETHDPEESEAGLDIPQLFADPAGFVTENIKQAVRDAVDQAVSDLMANVVGELASQVDPSLQALGGSGPAFALGIVGLASGERGLLGYRPWNGFTSAGLGVARFRKTFRVVQYGDHAPLSLQAPSATDTILLKKPPATRTPVGEVRVNLKDGYVYETDATSEADTQSSGVPVEIGRASFTYHLPIWMGFTHYGYLSTEKISDAPEYPVIPIYNASACPLEPHVAFDPEETDVTSMTEENIDYAEQLDAVKEELDAILWDTTGASSENLYDLLMAYRDAIVERRDRTDAKGADGLPTWADADPLHWEIAADSVVAHTFVDTDLIGWFNSPDHPHPSLDDKVRQGFRKEYDHGDLTALKVDGYSQNGWDETEIWEEIGGLDIPGSSSGWGNLGAADERPRWHVLPDDAERTADVLYDVELTLQTDRDYRTDVAGWIGVEITGLESDASNLGKLAAAVADYNEAMAQYQEDLADYQEDLEDYREDLRDWRDNDGDKEDRPERPDRPDKPVRPASAYESHYKWQSSYGQSTATSVEGDSSTSSRMADPQISELERRITVWTERKTIEDKLKSKTETMLTEFNVFLETVLGPKLHEYYQLQKDMIAANAAFAKEQVMGNADKMLGTP